MYPLIRYFIVACLLSMAMVTVTLGYYYHQTVINHMIQHKMDEQAALSQMLATNLWEEFSQYSQDFQNLTTDELLLHPEVRKFSRTVDKRADGFNILKMHIYASNGERIYSSDLPSVGRSVATLQAFKKALAGQDTTRLSHQEPAKQLNEVVSGRDIMINIIPLYNEDAKVSGVAEVHSDLTKTMAGINHNQTEAYVAIAINLGVMFAILFLVIRRAERRIKCHVDHLELRQRQIEHQSYHDAHTGLPNRNLFRDRLHHAIQLADQREFLMAVLAVNLHRLKHINDTFGHTIGNGLLNEVVARLNKCIRSCDTLARASGEEFYVMLESIAVIDEVEEIAAHMLQEFSRPAVVEDHELFVTPSIGIVMFPFADEDDAETLIKKASTAMYHANEAGRNLFHFYDSHMPHHIASRFSMESALRRALDKEEFELFYQPVVHLKTGKIIAVEALLRWRSPELGLVSPLDFVPLLEETGLIVPVGNWVLDTACAQAVAWQNQGIHDLKVNVNISAVQFSQKEITSQVRSAIDQSGLLPHLLDLEITESLLIDDINNAMQILDTLNDMGISLSIDDFGTGYSSLAYLKRMPIGTLKIDRSFICDLNADADDAAIVDAVCALAGSLRFKVTAEGVENREQLSMLQEMGVNAVQGFLFSRPLPVPEITNLLQQNSFLDLVA